MNEQLKKVLDDHQLWLETEGKEGKQANLSGANLSGADLRETNLRETDLSGADLDYSCWPLWCGTLRTKVDVRIASQLAYHFCSLDCDDPEYSKARNAIADFANKFHRAEECGKIEVEEEHEKI